MGTIINDDTQLFGQFSGESDFKRWLTGHGVPARLRSDGLRSPSGLRRPCWGVFSTPLATGGANYWTLFDLLDVIEHIADSGPSRPRSPRPMGWHSSSQVLGLVGGVALIYLDKSLEGLGPWLCPSLSSSESSSHSKRPRRDQTHLPTPPPTFAE